MWTVNPDGRNGDLSPIWLGESEAAAQVRHQFGCDQLRGYHFAPALTADAAFAWWATHESSLPAASSTQLV